MQVVGLLAVIALGVTVISLTLQRYFGPLPAITLLAPLLAALGAGFIGLWARARWRP
jgi:hypothetical protein